MNSRVAPEFSLLSSEVLGLAVPVLIGKEDLGSANQCRLPRAAGLLLT